jgi:aminopeptidase N
LHKFSYVFAVFQTFELISMMKRTLLLVFSLVLVASGQAQYNLPQSFDEGYCHHIRTAEDQMKYYYAPVTQDPLLANYDVSFYFLDLNVENNTVYLSGRVTTLAKSLVSDLDTFAFELNSVMSIDSVFVDGIQRAFQHSNNLALVPLDTPIPQGSLFTVKVVYHGTPPTGGFFSGITTAYNSQYQKDVTWTLSEPYAAMDWWPTKQDLNDKIDSVWVFLTTSSENKAGSQGLLTATTNMPDNKVRYEWKSYYPIAYYLISFAVADYQDYSIYAHPEGTDDSVLIQNYIYDHPNCLPNNQAGIDQTAEFVELFSDLYGLYPFIDEKYGHCLTQLGGGMEHQTMTTIGGFGFGLVAHELGHMWYGDDVTCATWSDIWINEGFATYSDYLAHSFLSTPYYDSLWLKIRHDQVKSQPGGSVYVPEDQLGDIWRIFDGRLSYSKGALLLHMIRFELQDDDMFFNVLQTYTEEFGDSVATGNDFRDWLEYISGKDFTDFFDQWYYGEGFPIFDIVWHEGGGNLTITSTQSTSTNVTTLFKMTVPYLIHFEDGTETTLLLFQDANINTYLIPLGKPIESIELDPEQWILHRLNSLSVGMEESDNPVHFSIGPNPAGDHFTIFFTHPAQDEFLVSIHDLSGRVLYENALESSKEKLTIQGMPSGVYMVSLSNGQETLRKKLVISK